MYQSRIHHHFTALLMLLATFASYAAIIDHGVYGELFPIVEEDMREVFRARLKHLTETGRMAEVEAEFKVKAEAAVVKPKAVAGLMPTAEERSFIHDPTLVIDNDIVDHQGNVLAKKGDRINPLDHMSLQKGLLFIDGEDAAQVSWAKERSDAYYIILVSGAPLKLSEAIGKPVYFDQGGHITKHFRIKQIPARIEQKDKLLQVTEFKIEEAP